MDAAMEESKGLEAEEMVDSSEDEQLKKEEEKEQSVSTISFTEEVKVPLRAVLMCECSHSQALTKIIFEDDLVEIGKGETEY